MYKAITNIKYNHLNQPTEVDLGTKKTIYVYTATGVKLQTKIYTDNNLENTTDYSGVYVYENNELSYIQIAGGRIVNNKFQYYLADHLGNIRVTFGKDENGEAEILQEDHYYPFGMRMSGQHFSNTSLINKYLYNGKEQQNQTNYYDYGFRQFDAQLGRWHVVDAMAEKYFSQSPYNYVGNNPISRTDFMGLTYRYKDPSEEAELNQWLHGGGIMDFINNINNHSGYGGRSGGSMYSRYLDSDASKRGMWYSTWIGLQNQAARENGIGSARIAYEAGYSFQPVYGEYGAGLGFQVDYTGKCIKGYTLVKSLEPGGFMSWINSFDHPSGGVNYFWTGVNRYGSSETKRNPNAEIGGNIGLLMDASGNYGGNMIQLTGKRYSIVEYIANLFGGFSRGDAIGGWLDVFFSDIATTNDVQTIETVPYPVDTINIEGYSMFTKGMDKVLYSNGAIIRYIYQGDTTYIDSINW